MEEQTGQHKQAEQQIFCLVYFIQMQITERLLGKVAQSSEPQAPDFITANVKAFLEGPYNGSGG